jgi:exopolysaccharide production protein ExoQ
MSYLALCFCAVFTAWLLYQDAPNRGRMSPGLWIPLIWFLMYSSRPIARWLGAGSGGSEEEGSSIDAIVQFCLIAGAFIVLNRRAFPWGKLVSLNPAFFLLFFYFALSIVWTIYPFIAFKRLFKEFGNVMIILVILTEADPAAAFKTICIRCAIIWFPLSEVLIRWFPHYGRQYGNSGFGMVTGVTTQKNTLGEICAFFGLVILWDMIDRYRNRTRGSPRGSFWPAAIVLAMGMALLLQSQSKTSLLAFGIGVAIFFSAGIKVVGRAPAFFAKCIFLAIAIGLVITAVWTITIAPLIESIGRDPTFTERTRIWSTVLDQNINPLIGCGFFSFWLEKGPSVWREFVNFQMNTAHSGYLEMYLDGGLIGCVLLGVYLLFTSWRAAGQFSNENTFARILFAMIMMALIINFSETCFFRLGITWCSLVLATLATHPLILQGNNIEEDAESYSPESVSATVVESFYESR